MQQYDKHNDQFTASDVEIISKETIFKRFLQNGEVPL